MKRDMRVYIGDILESIAKIEQYTKTITKGDFLEDTQVQDAVLRRLEIMGEAVKNIPQEFRDRYPPNTMEKGCRNEGYSYSRILLSKYRSNLEGCQ